MADNGGAGMKYHGSLLIWLIIVLASAAMYHAWGVLQEQQKQIAILQQQNRMLKANIKAVMAQDDIHLGLWQGECKRKPLVKGKRR